MGFKPQKTRREDGHDIGTGERRPGSLSPKSPAELLPTPPDPFVLLNHQNLSASSRFPFCTSWPPSGPSSLQLLCIPKSELTVSSNQAHVIISFTDHFLWGVCGVPDLGEALGWQQNLHRYQLCSQDTHLWGSWGHRQTDQSIRKVGDFRYCCDQSYNRNKTGWGDRTLKLGSSLFGGDIGAERHRR